MRGASFDAWSSIRARKVVRLPPPRANLQNPHNHRLCQALKRSTRPLSPRPLDSTSPLTPSLSNSYAPTQTASLKNSTMFHEECTGSWTTKVCYRDSQIYHTHRRACHQRYIAESLEASLLPLPERIQHNVLVQGLRVASHFSDEFIPNDRDISVWLSAFCLLCDLSLSRERHLRPRWNVEKVTATCRSCKVMSILFFRPNEQPHRTWSIVSARNFVALAYQAPWPMARKGKPNTM